MPKPFFLTKRLRDDWQESPSPLPTFSDDGVLTEKGLAILLEAVRKARELFLYMHPSWYYGDIPEENSVSIHDGILMLKIKLDWVSCSPAIAPNMVYEVPKHESESFENGSILDDYICAKINRLYVNVNCIFDLLKKGILPYLGDDFIAIRSTKQSCVFHPDLAFAMS